VFRFAAGERDFSVNQIVQAGPGTHTGTLRGFLGNKFAAAEIKNEWSVPMLPLRLHDVDRDTSISTGM